MKIRYFIVAIVCAVGIYGCSNDNRHAEYEVPPVYSPRLSVQEDGVPFTGVVEVYPCQPGSSIFFGNYVGNVLTTFPGMYLVAGGTVAVPQRPLRLPIGTYRMLYYGIDQVGIYQPMAMTEPGLRVGVDLAQQSFGLRRNSGDTVYMPVYNLAYNMRDIEIGTEGIDVALERVVAGLVVRVQHEDGSKLESSIKSIRAMVTGIAESINCYTAQPGTVTRTVGFDLTIPDDSLVASNLPAMVFPSVPNPILTLVFELDNGQSRIFTSAMSQTLSAGNMVTVTINVGQLFSDEMSGVGFEIVDWNEVSEIINTGPI